MRSETKTIYGVDVLGMVAMLKEIRRWWILRQLRKDWNHSYKSLLLCRKFSHLSNYEDLFNIENRYDFTRSFVKYHQLRGTIR